MNAIDRSESAQAFFVSTAVTTIVAAWFTLAFLLSLTVLVTGA